MSLENKTKASKDAKPISEKDAAQAEQFALVTKQMQMILFELRVANDSWKGQILATTVGRYRMYGRRNK